MVSEKGPVGRRDQGRNVTAGHPGIKANTVREGPGNPLGFPAPNILRAAAGVEREGGLDARDARAMVGTAADRDLDAEDPAFVRF